MASVFGPLRRWPQPPPVVPVDVHELARQHDADDDRLENAAFGARAMLRSALALLDDRAALVNVLLDARNLLSRGLGVEPGVELDEPTSRAYVPEVKA